MWGRDRRLTEADLDAAVKGAVADATATTIITAHIAQCERDKAEMREALKQQSTDRARMHQENQEQFAETRKTIDAIKRVLLLAIGGAAVLVFLTSAAGQGVINIIKGVH